MQILKDMSLKKINDDKIKFKAKKRKNKYLILSIMFNS